MARRVTLPLHSDARLACARRLCPKVTALPSPGETICGEIHLERLASASLGAEVFQPVFVARHDGRDEQLWLTVIDGAFLPTHVDLSTFMAGANGLTSVRHPALVRAVLVDREEDYCVVGYEQLPGAEALGDLIIRGGSRRLLARAAVEIARGLAFLHRREMLHGTLTPGTVVLWEGVPVLWEYGLAGLCDAGVFGPRSRSLGGDVVAPEVVTGAALTPAVDVFAWGAVMAAVASGELGSEAVALVMDGEVDPGRHGALFGLIRQALDPEPGRRPRDGVHLLELLQRALSSIEPGGPVNQPAQAADGGTDALRDLASRYLAEMEQVESGHVSPSGSSAPPAPSAPAVAPPPGEASGALGRVQLVRRREASGPQPQTAGDGVSRPWLAGTPARDGAVAERKAPSIRDDPRVEPAADATPPPQAIPAPEPAPAEPPTAEGGPGWTGRYKLPSGTYRAIVEAPQPQGPGLVRGPEPGVSGSDAGSFALGQPVAPAPDDSSARWASRPAEASPSGWLRPAVPRVPGKATDGLFDGSKDLRDLAHGVRKRWVLCGGAAAPPPSRLADDVPPPGVPRSMNDEEVTPKEPIDLSADGELAAEAPRAEDSMRGRLDLDEISDRPPSERDTPPDLEARSRGAEAAATAMLADEDSLPPMPEPEASEPRPADPAPSTGPAPQPFRVPRTPGPHGPSPVWMGLGSAVIAGVLALGATLAAASARGGFGQLWGGAASPSSIPGEPEPGQESAVAEAVDGCPKGMALIDDATEPFCIDRAEYPGLDRVPAIDVDLPHARQACITRDHALCSEAQWTRACKGESNWRYPYGPRREAGRCRVGEGGAAPGPAGADPHCVNPQGVLDLVGNVAEWTEEGIVMGGSVRSKKAAGCGARQRLKPTTRRPNVGFRCCFVPPPEPTESGTAAASDGP